VFVCLPGLGNSDIVFLVPSDLDCGDDGVVSELDDNALTFAPDSGNKDAMHLSDLDSDLLDTASDLDDDNGGDERPPDWEEAKEEIDELTPGLDDEDDSCIVIFSTDFRDNAS